MSKMSLGAITTGRVQEPYSCTIYGIHGSGKTTFAAGAPRPIFLPCENGCGHLDVARFPQPENWSDVRAAVQLLINEKHDYQTFVLDTLDAAEPLAWQEVMNGDPKKPKSIEEANGGYGRGVAAALVLWRGLLSDLDVLLRKGTNVILIGHSKVAKFKSPDLAVEPFDRYSLKLAPTASAVVMEWPKLVGFVDFEIMSTERDGRTLGVSTGKRLMHTQHRAAFDAKNRLNLPETLPLSWAAFEQAARAGLEVKQGNTTAAIQTLIAKASEALAKQATEALTKADSPEKLEKLHNWLRTKVN